MTSLPTKTHRLLFSGVFLLITILVGLDVGGDFNTTGLNWHIGLEIAIGLLSASAFCWLIYSRGTAMKELSNTQNLLEESQSESRQWQAEAKRWKLGSEVFIEGLSRSIDKTNWRLFSWKTFSLQ